MTILSLSFLAGILTILAPCVLPILPVIVGGSVINGQKSRPRLIILSFAISILIFTLTLQRLFAQFNLSRETLTAISACIFILLGLFYLFPSAWQRAMSKSGFKQATVQAQSTTKAGIRGDIILGAVMGPVFNTCSPTYAFVIAFILPVDLLTGITIILVYILGFSLILGLVARAGNKVVQKMRWAANPNGIFRKIIAILIILVGLAILFKREKKIETWIIDNGYNLDATLRELEQLSPQ